MLIDTKHSPNAHTCALAWDAVRWTEGFWADVEKTCAESTVPHIREMFENPNISHVVDNFKIAANAQEGNFAGTPFGDGDFYKWMESAMYMAAKTNDQELLKALDDYIALIGKAQQDDGYISTKQIIGERIGSAARLGDINDFEVYNFGHLFTAACLYKRLTGKEAFLNIARKAACYLEHLYEEAKRTGVVKTAVCPSHYMGLVELYRTTGENRFLELAGLSISMRDSVKNGMDDNQDRLPLKQHNKIIGHAVRANYLYAGVADLYAETGDAEYLSMLFKVWENLVNSKMYITGGCGALYNGVSPYGNFWVDQKVHQAYGYEYQLPNITAYNETCASIGCVLWAYRMFAINPDPTYFDIIERIMLNVNLAAISLDGKRFFYENMLRRAKNLPFELCWPLERKEYLLSYCCPPNLARILAESSEYAYTVSDDAVWTGMYGASQARLRLENGADFTLTQDTEYPWDGKITFTLSDVRQDKPIRLNLRIPGWVESGSVSCCRKDGQILNAAHAGSYVTLNLSRLEGAVVELVLDMPVRQTVSHPLVEENNNQIAIERGPLVYCMESPDAAVESLDELLFGAGSEISLKDGDIGGRKMVFLEGPAFRLKKASHQLGKLYQSLKVTGIETVPVRLIPYFAWDNRGMGEMRIWMPVIHSIQP